MLSNPPKLLQLIIFIATDDKPIILLSDTLYYNPDYQPGAILHLVSQPYQPGRQTQQQDYVVLTTKHVIATDHINQLNDHILLVEVTELTEAERS